MDKAHKTAGRVLLPSYVQPTKYDLKLTPDLVNFTFEGLAKIEFRTSESADKETEIILHAKEIMFRSASFTSEGKTVHAEEVRKKSKSRENIIISLSIPLTSTLVRGDCLPFFKRKLS